MHNVRTTIGPKNVPTSTKMMRALPADSLASSFYSTETARIEQEGEFVRSHYEQHVGAGFIRLGDGELNILLRRNYLSERLRSAVEQCSILGLPDNFNQQIHPWRPLLQREIPQQNKPVVSAVLPLALPSLVPSIVRGKRALWITNGANIICERLKDKAFCDFFGFEYVRKDLHLDSVPRGRTLPYVPNNEESYIGLLETICRESDRRDFDIAVVGMGCLGKMVVSHISSRGRSAVDAGCILSAMRGEVDREVFKKDKELKSLVWTGKPLSRRVILVLRSGGEYRPSHVFRLAAQLPTCEISVLTDFPAKELPGFAVIPMEYRWPKWWSKMELFRPDIKGSFLYVDLDTVVRDFPDTFFRHNQSLALGVFTAVEKERGYLKTGNHGYLQSGMMLLHEDDRAELWKRWMTNPELHMRSNRGDQDFLTEAGLKAKAWQDVFPGQVCSYKLNWLPKRNERGLPLEEDKVNVICFHGQPRPWKVVGVFPCSQPRPASCVLVGNGPSILKGRHGARIDDFEEVVRFNAFAVRGFEESVGTKTTMWSTFGRETLPKDGDVRPSRILYVHGDSGNLVYEPKELVRIPMRIYNLVRKLVQSRSDLPSTEGIIPSSGLLVAWWYLEVVQMQRISIIGFDHFSKAEDSRHHYWNPQIFVPPKEHDGAAEARIIQDYVAEGRLERLT